MSDLSEIIDEELVNSWCVSCEHTEDLSGCNGCSGVIDVFNPEESLPPSNYKRKDDKKMIVTIIGSISRSIEIEECKKYWIHLAHTVHAPRLNIEEPLVHIQTKYIQWIEEADLIVAIPKTIKMNPGTPTTFSYEFGDSTSYEMAIAEHFNKKIVIW